MGRCMRSKVLASVVICSNQSPHAFSLCSFGGCGTLRPAPDVGKKISARSATITSYFRLELGTSNSAGEATR